MAAAAAASAARKNALAAKAATLRWLDRIAKVRDVLLSMLPVLVAVLFVWAWKSCSILAPSSTSWGAGGSASGDDTASVSALLEQQEQERKRMALKLGDAFGSSSAALLDADATVSSFDSGSASSLDSASLGGSLGGRVPGLGSSDSAVLAALCTANAWPVPLPTVILLLLLLRVVVTWVASKVDQVLRGEPTAPVAAKATDRLAPASASASNGTSTLSADRTPLASPATPMDMNNPMEMLAALSRAAGGNEGGPGGPNGANPFANLASVLGAGADGAGGAGVAGGAGGISKLLGYAGTAMSAMRHLSSATSDVSTFVFAAVVAASVAQHL
jgi:hypothetical protein